MQHGAIAWTIVVCVFVVVVAAVALVRLSSALTNTYTLATPYELAASSVTNVWLRHTQTRVHIRSRFQILK